MKKKYLTLVLMASIASVFSQPTEVQDKWTVELRPGVNFATQDLGNIELKTGYGFEGTVAYKFLPHLSAYAGWSWNSFAADNSSNAGDLEFEETGYCFGLQFVHPLPNFKASYVIKAGATYNHIETEDSSGEITNDTGHGFGWEVGGGIRFPLGSHWHLTPEIRYRSLSTDMRINSVNIPVHLNYFSVGAGLNYSF